MITTIFRKRVIKMEETRNLLSDEVQIEIVRSIKEILLMLIERAFSSTERRLGIGRAE